MTNTESNMKIKSKLLAAISIILAIILFFIANTRAECAGDNLRKEIYLKVIHINSPYSMNSSAAYEIYQQITKFFTLNSEIELHPSGFLSLEDPLPHLNKLSDYVPFRVRSVRLWSKIVRFKLNHKAKNREIILIIDRSLEYNESFNYSGGHSDVCSLYCSACYSYTYGNPTKSALKIAIHEVGHALGVKGHEDNTIMDADIPNYILGEYSKKRIAGCNRKTTKRKIFECRGKKRPRKCLRRNRLR